MIQPEIPVAVVFIDGGVIAAFADGEVQMSPPEGEAYVQHTDDPVYLVKHLQGLGGILFPTTVSEGLVGEA
tara:strand:+ start:1036 stop:1248 length:213 start_codon:yes stop_codon:yes gene_type:complete